MKELNHEISAITATIMQKQYTGYKENVQHNLDEKNNNKYKNKNIKQQLANVYSVRFYLKVY